MPVNKKTLKNDIILVSVILLLAVIIFAVFKITMKNGDYVVVSVSGVEEMRFSLYENREVEIISGQNGEYTNILVIEDNKAYMLQADCPDGICVEHKAISKTGETIVCLPHKVVISIEAGETSVSEPDIVI